MAEWRTVRLKKTEMCANFTRSHGYCRFGDDCWFAHAVEELRQKPDLTQTSLCKSMTKAGFCADPNCRFAHSEAQLRSISIKWKRCNFHRTGRCKNGVNCHFAHSLEEQQQARQGGHEPQQQQQQHVFLPQSLPPATAHGYVEVSAPSSQGDTTPSNGGVASPEYAMNNQDRERHLGEVGWTTPPAPNHDHRNSWSSATDSVASDGVSNAESETRLASDWSSGSCSREDLEDVGPSNDVAVAAGQFTHQLPWMEKQDQTVPLTTEHLALQEYAWDQNLLAANTFTSLTSVKPSSGNLPCQQMMPLIMTQATPMMPIGGSGCVMMVQLVPLMPLDTDEVYTD